MLDIQNSVQQWIEQLYSIGPATVTQTLGSSPRHCGSNMAFTDKLINSLRMPVGIEIGASTSEEIALCIMAEIIAVRNGVRT